MLSWSKLFKIKPYQGDWCGQLKIVSFLLTDIYMQIIVFSLPPPPPPYMQYGHYMHGFQGLRNSIVLHSNFCLHFNLCIVSSFNSLPVDLLVCQSTCWSVVWMLSCSYVNRAICLSVSKLSRSMFVCHVWSFTSAWLVSGKLHVLSVKL